MQSNKQTFAAALCAFCRCEKGVTTIEYGLIVAFIAVAIINAALNIGHGSTGNFEYVEKAMK
ncbi:MAG: Flp family type IVb pilin [Pseudomonadota bacterium]